MIGELEHSKNRTMGRELLFEMQVLQIRQPLQFSEW